VRERVGELRGRWIEDAVVRGRKPAERDAEGEAEMIGRGLGVEGFFVFGERVVLGAVDGELGPGLSVAPRGRAGVAELDGWLAVGLVLGEGGLDGCEDFVRKKRETADIADLKAYPWIERFHGGAALSTIHRA
jgi:hypothetical protein